jgi:hypothetical protein
MSVFHSRLLRISEENGSAVYSVQSFDFNPGHEWEEIASLQVSLPERKYHFSPGEIWRRERILPPSLYALPEAERHFQFEKLWRPRGFSSGAYAHNVHKWATQFIETLDLPARWPQIFFASEGQAANKTMEPTR